MKITYIHHSSFLAELEQVSLLFDYFEGELPAVSQEKPLVVFSSHRHGDHFAPVIFELADRFPQVYYVLSDDIWRKRVPEKLRERTCFMGAGQQLLLEEQWPGLPKMQISTLKSTDEGVAFLIETEEARIYHAGDLNNWVWAGEPESYNLQMSGRFHQEIQKLKGQKIDVAFMLLDPRQEGDFWRGMDEFMRTAEVKTVFPMHFWGDFQVTERFKQLDCAEEYRDRIVEIHEKGETFEIE